MMADVPNKVSVMNDTIRSGAWDKGCTDIMYITTEYPNYEPGRFGGVTVSVFARRWGGEGFNSRPKPRQAIDVKSCTHCCYVRCATLPV